MLTNIISQLERAVFHGRTLSAKITGNFVFKTANIAAGLLFTETRFVNEVTHEKNIFAREVANTIAGEQHVTVCTTLLYLM